MMTQAQTGTNPFIGLRPFELDQQHLFFGREEQIDDLIRRLGQTRFLAVVGPSGSGKSSLIGAGLIHELNRAAHSLKGSLKYLGAGPAAEAAFELETMGDTGTLEGSAETLSTLERELARLDRALPAPAGDAAPA